MKQFIALSSPRGSTFTKVVTDPTLAMPCIGVITEEDGPAIALARDRGIPHAIIPWPASRKRAEHEQQIRGELVRIHEVQQITDTRETILTMMGWKRILTVLIAQWRGRILNVHPALLPKYGGKGWYGDRVHQAVHDAGDTESGITIHIADEGTDTGPILLQRRCALDVGMTAAEIAACVKALEPEAYRDVLNGIAEGSIRLPE